MQVINKYRNTALLQGVVDVFAALREKERSAGGSILQGISATQDVDVALRALDVAINDKIKEMKAEVLSPAFN